MKARDASASKKFNQVEKGHKILSKYLVGEVDGREDGEVKV